MIKTSRINVFYENFNELQESAIFYDHKVIDASIDMMSWVSIIIWLQDHILIW